MNCYPACLKRPLIAFASIVVVLIVLSFAFCASGMCSAKEPPKEVEVVQVERQIVVEPKIDHIAIIKQNFLDRGEISDKFIAETSVFFDRDRAEVGASAINAMNEKINSEINDTRLIIISGHACDLGSAEYNKRLIQERINFVIDKIASKNPNVEIIFSNDGQARAPRTDIKAEAEAERREERRVDIYLYGDKAFPAEVISEVVVEPVIIESVEASDESDDFGISIIPFLAAFCAIAIGVALWSSMRNS